MIEYYSNSNSIHINNNEMNMKYVDMDWFTLDRFRKYKADLNTKNAPAAIFSTFHCVILYIGKTRWEQEWK